MDYALAVIFAMMASYLLSRTLVPTMMLYLMPGMFTVFLLSTASGLSIYYLVQQIAAIPQQWLIANERGRSAVGKKT